MRFLILRRCVQVGLLLLYGLAYHYGVGILEGNLSASMLFGVLPLADPLAVLQLLLSGGALGTRVLVGAFVVLLVYGLLFGRGYCAFVCPINMITDSANAFVRWCHLKGSHWGMSKKWRYYILAIALCFTPIAHLPLLELVNPVSLVHRGLVFGMGFGISVMVAIWLFDVLMVEHGFCSHLCPVGAFYALLGRFSLVRVRYDQNKCTLCMACKEICPEKQVLSMIGKGSGEVKGMECCKCGRCIEVCHDDALSFDIRDFVKRKGNEKD